MKVLYTTTQVEYDTTGWDFDALDAAIESGRSWAVVTVGDEGCVYINLSNVLAIES